MSLVYLKSNKAVHCQLECVGGETLGGGGNLRYHISSLHPCMEPALIRPLK